MADDEIKEEKGNTRWGAIKGYVPGLIAIKGAWSASYGCASSAVGSLGRAICASVPGKVAAVVPDPDRRDLIGKAIGGAVISASTAALEDASGLIPGGRLAYRSVKAGATRFQDVYSKGLPAAADGSNKEPDLHVKKKVVEKRLDDLELKLCELRTENEKLKEEVRELRSPPTPPPAAPPSPFGAGKTTGGAVAVLEPHREPEDVIRLFMMRGFKGGDFLDALLVPSIQEKKA